MRPIGLERADQGIGPARVRRRQPEQGRSGPCWQGRHLGQQGRPRLCQGRASGRCPRAGEGAGSVSASSQSLPVGRGAVSCGASTSSAGVFAGCAAPSGLVPPARSRPLCCQRGCPCGPGCAGAQRVQQGILHGEGSLLICVGVNNDAQSTLSRDLLHPGRALFALWRWQTSASPGAEMTDNESGAGPEAGPRHHG